jgi:hypothetical protein
MSIIHLNSHVHFDLWVRFVPVQLEIVKSEVFDVGYFSFDGQLGEWARCALDLNLQRFNVIRINVCISQAMYKISRLKIKKRLALKFDSSIIFPRNIFIELFQQI